MANGTNQNPDKDNDSGNGGSISKILGLLAILGLIALGAGAYWFLTLGPTATPTAENPIPSVTPMTAPSEPVVNAGGEVSTSPQPGTRRGIVLEDNVNSFEKEFDDKSTKMETFQTGDQVLVYDHKWKGAEGGDSAYHAGTEKRGWIDGKYILIPEEVGALDIFISSTPPLAEMMRDTPQSEKDKLAILDSKEFLLRCAHNMKQESSSPCIRRYFYSSPNGAVLRWMELALDANIINNRPIMSEQFPVFGNLSNVDVDKFTDSYKKLPDDLKKLIWESNCAQLATEPALFLGATKANAKGTQVVFDSFAVCINESIAKNRSDYASLIDSLKKELKGKLFTAKQRKALKI